MKTSQLHNIFALPHLNLSWHNKLSMPSHIITWLACSCFIMMSDTLWTFIKRYCSLWRHCIQICNTTLEKFHSTREQMKISKGWNMLWSGAFTEWENMKKTLTLPKTVWTPKISSQTGRSIMETVERTTGNPEGLQKLTLKTKIYISVIHCCSFYRSFYFMFCISVCLSIYLYQSFICLYSGKLFLTL